MREKKRKIARREEKRREEKRREEKEIEEKRREENGNHSPPKTSVRGTARAHRESRYSMVDKLTKLRVANGYICMYKQEIESEMGERERRQEGGND